MSEIPKDIRKTVDELMDAYAAPGYRPILRGLLCKAILAERERCFDIANAEQREWQKHSPITEYGRGREGGASVISAFIRGEA